MRSTSEFLLADLKARTHKHIRAAKELLTLSDDVLNQRSSEKSWSALECLEHLNLYGDFYLPEIQSRMERSRHVTERTFKSGLLGNYFAQSMLPKAKLNKMKTFNDKNPIGSSLTRQTIHHFIAQQQEMLTLLQKAAAVSLNRTKTRISIPFPVKLKLGDTFRFVIYHNERHIAQALGAITP
ncbi:MAG: DinB family protein [Cryomorphaceae bacterium]|nr:MAG: DinB family protein [Cryomorphaceae bacterium]